MPGDWRKSSYSGQDGNCLEVLAVQGGILVRDTKARGAGPVLAFPAGAWRAFAEQVRKV